MRIPVVGVMGSGSEEWADLSTHTGRLIARLGCHLLCGGGRGVMLAVCRSFVSYQPRKGLAIGVLPSKADEHGEYTPPEGYPNEFVELVITTPLGGAWSPLPNRNLVNVLSSDALVILPGGAGTLQEANLALAMGTPMLAYGPEVGFPGFPSRLVRTEEWTEVQAFLEQTLGERQG